MAAFQPNEELIERLHTIMKTENANADSNGSGPGSGDGHDTTTGPPESEQTSFEVEEIDIKTVIHRTIGLKEALNKIDHDKKKLTQDYKDCLKIIHEYVKKKETILRIPRQNKAFREKTFSRRTPLNKTNLTTCISKVMNKDESEAKEISNLIFNELPIKKETKLVFEKM